MFDWLPDKQPQRAFAVFGLVLALCALVIIPLTLADGGDGGDNSFEGASFGEDENEGANPLGQPPRPTPPPPPTTTTPPPPPPTTPTTPTPPGEPTPQPPEERSIGQTGTDDGVDFTVTSLREVDKIERDEYYKRDYKPPRGGSLVAAEVTFVNNTKEAIDPFCGGNSASLVDQNGRMHETLDELYSITGNDAVCGSAGTLPGDKATVILAWRLGRGEQISHLDLWNGKYTPDFDGEASRVRVRP